MSLPSNPSFSASAGPSCWQNEATEAVQNLRTRGVAIYRDGSTTSTTKDRLKLQTALDMFRRGSRFPSADVDPSVRAAINKNLLVCLKDVLQMDCLDEDTQPIVDEAFFQLVSEASVAFQAASNAASNKWMTPASSDSFQRALYNTLQSFLTTAGRLVAVSELEASADSSISRHRSYFCRRARFRVHSLQRILSITESCSELFDHQFHFMAADVLFKASINMQEMKDPASALYLIAEAEQHLSLSNGVNMSQCTAAMSHADDDDGEGPYRSLKSQLWYQRCAMESARAIQRGILAMHQAASRQRECSDREVDVFCAIDHFKEAQVLAREVSLEYETQAVARLALIFRTFDGVKDSVKSNIYYNQAFSLLQTLGPQLFAWEDWAVDVTRERERIQKEAAVREDKGRDEVIQKHKTMLDGIRNRLNVYGEETEALLHIYKAYPPKHNCDPPKEKLESDGLKSGLKIVLLHYHPDRNGAEKHGKEHAVICEEITKMVNLLYGRKFKDM